MPYAAQAHMPQLRVGKGRQVHQLMAACRSWMRLFKYCSSYSASACMWDMCSRELSVYQNLFPMFGKCYHVHVYARYGCSFPVWA